MHLELKNETCQAGDVHFHRIGSNENASNTLQYAIDFAKELNAKVFVFRAYKALSKAGTLININNIFLMIRI